MFEAGWTIRAPAAMTVAGRNSPETESTEGNMKLYATIAVYVSGEKILCRPGWRDRVRQVFGGEPELRAERMRASLEATAVVDAFPAASATLAGATS